MPTTERPDQRVLEAYIDNFIVGLIKRVGLKVKVRRTAATTTLTVSLPRANQG
jgi:hypothetical protein